VQEHGGDETPPPGVGGHGAEVRPPVDERLRIADGPVDLVGDREKQPDVDRDDERRDKRYSRPFAKRVAKRVLLDLARLDAPFGNSLGDVDELSRDFRDRGS
jgi:hypothetical protein